MKVALVHDYLKEYGGGERVLEVLHRIYPDAPVYTAFVSAAGLGSAASRFANWDIRTTFTQKLPGINRRPHAWRFMIPYIWETLDLSEFDVVICSSSGYLSKSVLTRPETLHIAYCHTPPWYLWEQPAMQKPLSWWHRWYEVQINSRLRQYDFYTSQRVDRFIANSEEVARRIAKFHRRIPETIIHPPVQVRGQGEAGNDYYLYVGRLAPGKQVELAIQACNRLDRPLWIVGTGSEEANLRAMAGKQTKFLGFKLLEEMVDIYANAKALIFPCANEAFGIVPVEAMGHGVPIIAFENSGVRESVINYKTGLFFPEPTVESLRAAIEEFEGLHFSSQACIERAREFSEPVFMAKFQQAVAQALKEKQQPYLKIGEISIPSQAYN